MGERAKKPKKYCRQRCPYVEECIHVRKARDKALEQTRKAHFYRNTLLEETARKESIEKQLLTDPLTGASNRNGLEKKFFEECSKVERFRDQKLFMIFMDIDNFHRFNSEHGEHTGDIVLQEVVRTIERNMRKYDSVHRIGGEEFIILLPELEELVEESGSKALYNVCSTADRIRKAIGELRVVPHDKGAPLSVTVSVGVARLGSGDSLATLIDKANKAELEAKRTGKNRSYLFLGGEVLPVENLLTKGVQEPNPEKGPNPDKGPAPG